MNSEIIPPEFGYNIYQKDRVNVYRGVILPIIDRISSVDLFSLGTDCEIVWAQLNFARSPMFIATYYRPHMSDDYSLMQLDLSLQKLKETIKNATIIQTGDFNLPGIDWSESLLNMIHLIKQYMNIR